MNTQASEQPHRQPEELDALSTAYWSGDLEPQADDLPWQEEDAIDDRPSSTLADFLAEMKTQRIVIRRRKRITEVPMIGALFIGLFVPQLAVLTIIGMVFGWWRLDIVRAGASKPGKRGAG